MRPTPPKEKAKIVRANQKVKKKNPENNYEA